jgi:hypothetical protein
MGWGMPVPDPPETIPTPEIIPAPETVPIRTTGPIRNTSITLAARSCRVIR